LFVVTVVKRGRESGGSWGSWGELRGAEGEAIRYSRQKGSQDFGLACEEQAVDTLKELSDYLVRATSLR